MADDTQATHAVRLYRPSNGSEGCGFFAAWCERCARDKPMSEGKPFDACGQDEICQIIADTFAYNLEDEKYPREWRYDDKGIPCCTAFIHAGDPTPREVDTRTADMFVDPAQ